MSKRIYSQTIIKWAKIVGISSTSIIFLIFSYLSLTGCITINSVSGDMVCAGTIEEPCYAYVSFTAKEDVFIYPTGYDPWGRSVGFDFDPAPKEAILQRSWGEGWRTIDLSKTWSVKVKYAIKFSKGTTYNIRIKAYKNNPTDVIKWGFGSDEFGINAYEDPYWLSVDDSASVNIVINSSSQYNWVI